MSDKLMPGKVMPCKVRAGCIAVFLSILPLPVLPADPQQGGGEAVSTDVAASAAADVSADGALVRVRGRVRLVGNMPFPELVVTGDDDVDWYVLGDDRKKIEQFNGQRITVTGTARVREMRLADGAAAGLRRRLENITVTGR
jgi:hypothetical protein